MTTAPKAATRIAYDLDPIHAGPFRWDAFAADGELISSHQTVEDAMRSHPMAHVSRASWEAYVLERETAMAGKVTK